MAGITLVAATPLEFRALRRQVPSARIELVGIALEKAALDFGEIVVSCGLAGALRADLPTGTVLIPRRVRRPGGGTLHCDEELVEAFATAARRIGHEPVFDPLLTSEEIVHGGARARWAGQGYAAVDMETGRIEAPRVAAVRVVLDTPQREISPEWRRPLRALLNPMNWPQALWLSREAPRAAALSASVVAAAQGIVRGMRITRP